VRAGSPETLTNILECNY